MILLPLFPLYVEAMKADWSVRPESVLLTAAVLSAGYLISSQTYLPRAWYAIVFLLSIGYDFHPQNPISSIEFDRQLASSGLNQINFSAENVATMTIDWDLAFGGWCGNHFPYVLLMSAIFVHGMERFSWHVVLDRKFPEWLK
jgi:hypothetical protein